MQRRGGEVFTATTKTARGDERDLEPALHRLRRRDEDVVGLPSAGEPQNAGSLLLRREAYQQLVATNIRQKTRAAPESSTVVVAAAGSCRPTAHRSSLSLLHQSEKRK